MAENRLDPGARAPRVVAVETPTSLPCRFHLDRTPTRERLMSGVCNAPNTPDQHVQFAWPRSLDWLHGPVPVNAAVWLQRPGAVTRRGTIRWPLFYNLHGIEGRGR